MIQVAQVGRLLFAALIVGAAGAKIFDIDGLRYEMLEARVPRRLYTALAPALIVAEVAIGLCVAASSWFFGVVIALALLAAYSIHLGRLVAQGRSGGCHCLGRRFSFTPRWALVRNGLLGLLLLPALYARDFSPRTTATPGVVGAVTLVIVASAVMAHVSSGSARTRSRLSEQAR